SPSSARTRCSSCRGSRARTWRSPPSFRPEMAGSQSRSLTYRVVPWGDARDRAQRLHPCETAHFRGARVKVRFWGVRGSYPVPSPHTNRYGGNTSCVEVRIDGGPRIIIDAGTGIRKLGKEMMQGEF